MAQANPTIDARIEYGSLGFWIIVAHKFKWFIPYGDRLTINPPDPLRFRLLLELTEEVWPGGQSDVE